MQWSAVSVKMLAGSCADHTEHGNVLKDRESKQLRRRRVEASKRLAVNTEGGDYDYMC